MVERSVTPKMVKLNCKWTALFLHLSSLMCSCQTFYGPLFTLSISCPLQCIQTIFHFLGKSIKMQRQKTKNDFQVVLKQQDPCSTGLKIVSQLSRCCAARPSHNGFNLVGPTKVKARKSFLFTEKFPKIESKEHLLYFVITFILQ